MSALETAPTAPLKDVEWRVDGKPSGAKARFVPYLNAPTVASLLDQWVGAANWSDRYEPVAQGKGLWCHLSVRAGAEWVTKTDIGVPSNFEGEKGQVSDAFKRVACLKWGVGRNVYDLPTLWAPCRVDAKGNAWPNDETLPHIQKQLKALGFDASGGTVAAYHDDPEPTDRESGGASDRKEEGEAGTSRLDPAPPTANTPALATFDTHNVIRADARKLEGEQRTRFEAWWRQQELPSIKDKDALTEAQGEMVLSFLDELQEQRERRSERAAQVLAESGMSEADALAARAQAMADKKRPPVGGQDAAAGEREEVKTG